MRKKLKATYYSIAVMTNNITVTSKWIFKKSKLHKDIIYIPTKLYH